MPSWYGSPSTAQSRSLNSDRHAAERTVGQRRPALRRAPSRSSGWITAFSSRVELLDAVRSRRRRARAATPRRVRTSSACAVASSHVESVIGSSVVERSSARYFAGPARSTRLLTNRGGRRARCRAPRRRPTRPTRCACARGTRPSGRRARATRATRSPTDRGGSGPNVMCSSEQNHTLASSIEGLPWSMPSAFRPQSATARVPLTETTVATTCSARRNGSPSAPYAVSMSA